MTNVSRRGFLASAGAFTALLVAGVAPAPAQEIVHVDINKQLAPIPRPVGFMVNTISVDSKGHTIVGLAEVFGYKEEAQSFVLDDTMHMEVRFGEPEVFFMSDGCTYYSPSNQPTRITIHMPFAKLKEEWKDPGNRCLVHFEFDEKKPVSFEVM